jgi:hypothetical protein
MLEVGICSTFQPAKLTTVFRWCSNLVIVLVGEDVEVHLHVLQYMIEQFKLWEGGHCLLGKLLRYSEIMSWVFSKCKPFLM